MSKIRPCSERDLSRMFEIINDSAMAYKGVIPADRWHEPYMPMVELCQEIDAGVRFFGYYEEDLLVGIMGIQDVKDVTLIRHAYVESNRRHGGIGSQLLIHLLGIATRPVLIGTWTAAVWAVRFYERHGFRQVSEEEKNVLLKRYWSVPERQIATSVVLADATFRFKD